MLFSPHARRRMRLRGIRESDVVFVVTRPTKIASGDYGAMNYWGNCPESGYRIRVTVYPDGGVGTVAWADRRKVEES